MALVDNKTLTVVDTNWMLLLGGDGIITNVSDVNQNLIFRYDVEIPEATDVGRVLYGRGENSDKDSFVNTDSLSSVYGKAMSGTVKVLITNNIDY